MTKQSKLEEKAIAKRSELIVKNDYVTGNEYSDKHKNAISDGDVKGKGLPNNEGSYTHTIPWQTSNTAPSQQIKTTGDIGGEYDIKGRQGVGGGREYLQKINLYSENNQYGADMIDTSKSPIYGEITI